MKKTQSWLKKRKLPAANFDSCAGLTFDGGSEFLVWVDLSQKPEDILDTAIHEAVHVYQMICSFLGEESKAEEFQAYTIAYIASSIIKQVNKERNSALHTDKQNLHQMQERFGTTCLE
jgi:hypothetical protein